MRSLRCHQLPRTPRRPAEPGQLSAHRIIESVRDIAHLRQAQDLRALAEAAAISLRCNNTHTQLAAARAGLGLLALPHYMAGFAPELQPVLESQFQVQLDLWLLTHRDLRHSARVRAVLDFLAEEVRADPLCHDDRKGIRVA